MENAGNKLSNETIAILKILPEDLTGGKYNNIQTGNVKISRIATNIEKPKNNSKSHKSMGMSIAVKQQQIDVIGELENAYEYLNAGRTERAITVYKEILQSYPHEPLALFGLATTYHRVGSIANARDAYGHLLQIEPNNLEALNNFLALVGEESPYDAIEIMDKLAAKNPDFSPIYAQISVLHDRVGQSESAVRSMLEAIAIEPENLVYQYNLAVLYDSYGHKIDAVDSYRRLIEASYRGQKIPADSADLQERIIYLSAK